MTYTTRNCNVEVEKRHFINLIVALYIERLANYNIIPFCFCTFVTCKNTELSISLLKLVKSGLSF